MTLDAAPDVDVGVLTLDAGRPVDRTGVAIPVQPAFTGLVAADSIAMTREGAAEPQNVSFGHDFFAARSSC